MAGSLAKRTEGRTAARWEERQDAVWYRARPHVYGLEYGVGWLLFGVMARKF